MKMIVPAKMIFFVQIVAATRRHNLMRLVMPIVIVPRYKDTLTLMLTLPRKQSASLLLRALPQVSTSPFPHNKRRTRITKLTGLAKIAPPLKSNIRNLICLVCQHSILSKLVVSNQ